jgi:A/G-specific adenine glycosylase
VAHATGLQHVLPAARPRKVRPQRAAYLLLLKRADGAVLLEQRPPSGVWGGLWSFPQFEARAAALQWLGASGNAITPLALPAYHHAFTHFDLVLHPLLVDAARLATVAEGSPQLWYDPRQPATIGLAKPTVDLIELLKTHA